LVVNLKACGVYAALVMKRPDRRQTAPYSPELEPDIVLTELNASDVDENLHTLW
jgi:hypothetical protein